jgi:aspartyl-tRNA(Asn)/glutamyl-tRNA(Gln) amidotransferase subunit A
VAAGAAAVAAGEGWWGLGTDTGGSVRQPAALCGIVGLKPTYGRVSRYGLISFGSSLDVVGPMTRDVRDAALLLQAISGHDRRDSTSANVEVPYYLDGLDGGVDGLRVGVVTELMDDRIDAGVRDVVGAVAEGQRQHADAVGQAVVRRTVGKRRGSGDDQDERGEAAGEHQRFAHACSSFCRSAILSGTLARDDR